MATTKTEWRALKKYGLEGNDLLAGRILLAGIRVGANEAEVSKATGIEPAFVRTVGRRLRRNGVWYRRETRADWFDKELGGIGFLCDVLVGSGMMKRAKPVTPHPAG